MKQVRITITDGRPCEMNMMWLEISTDGGKSWEVSRGYPIRGNGAREMVSIEAITELKRCISMGYTFVLK